MRKMILAAALSATMLAGSAFAGQQATAPATSPAHGQAKWAQVDTNGDGAVSRDEATAMADQRFNKLDKNSDGQLAADEMAMRHGRHHRGHRGMHGKSEGGQSADRSGRRAEMMKRFDSNGDGSISDTERQAARAEMMKRFDTNKDGTVSADERQAARAEWGGHRGARAGGEGHGKGREAMGTRMLAKLDTDKSGTVSATEFRAQAMTRFAGMDANKDGRIDAAERSAATARMHERFADRGAKRHHGQASPDAGAAQKPTDQ